MDSAAGGSLGSASGEITLTADGALRSLNAVSNGLRNLDQQSRSQSGGLLSWARNNEQAINTVGTGLAGFGAIVLGSFGIATATAVDFEKQISAVGSVTGATGDTLAAMREEALRLGSSTAFSASESAVAMEILAKAGATTEQILGGATEDVMNLAAATGVDVPLAAETAATAMNIFGTSSENAADTIAQSANASALDVNDWALALKAAGPVAASLGLDMEDLAQAMVILGDAGIKGETGGTALRNILMGLADPAGDASVGLRELGVETHNADGSFRGLEEVTHDLASAWGTMDAAQKLQIATMIAGEQGAASFIALMDAQTKAVNEGGDAFENASERMDETGTASTQAQARMDNFAGSMEELKGAIETVAIEFGSRLLPAFRKVVDGATKLLRKILDLPGPVKTALAAFAGIVGVLATLGGGFLLMLPRIAATQAALASLGGVSGILGAIMGALLSPVVLITAALVALALVFKDDIIAAVESAVKWFKDFVETSAHVQNMVDDLRSAFDAFKDGDYGKAFELVGRAAGQLWEAIKEAVAEIDWGAVGTTLLDGLMGLASFVAGIVLDLGSIAVSVAGWLWNQAVDLWTGLKNWAIGLVPEGDPVNIGTIAAGIAGWAFSAAQDIWEALTGWLFGGTFGDGTGGATAGKVGQVSLGEVAANIANWAFTSMVDLWTTLRDWVMGQITGKDWSAVGTEVAGGIRDAIRDGIQNAADLFAILLSWVSDQIRGVDWNSVGSTFADLLIGGIKGIVGLVGLAGWLLGQILLAIVEVKWGEVGKAFALFMKTAILAVANFLAGFGEKMYAEITSELSRINWAAIGGAVKEWAAGIWQGIIDALQPIIDAAVTSLNWLIDQLNRIPGVDIPKIGGIEQIGTDADTAKEKVVSLQSALQSMATGGIFAMDDRSRAAAAQVGYTPYSNPYNPTEGGGGSMGGIEYKPLSDLAVAIDKAATSAATLSTNMGPVNTSFLTLTGQTSNVSSFGSTSKLAFDDTGKAANAGFTPIPGLVGAMAGALMGQAIPALVTLQSQGRSAFDTLRSVGTSAMTALASAVMAQASAMQAQVTASFTAMRGNATSQMSAMASAAQSAGSQMAAGLTNGANAGLNGVRSALSAIPGIVAGIGGSAASTAYSIGANISNSFAAGMRSALGSIIAAANQMVAAADTALRARAQIASPSKVFRRLGTYLGEGFEGGILATVRDVEQAARRLVSVPGLPGMGLSGAVLPSYAYATPAASGPTVISNTYVYAVRSDEWQGMVRQIQDMPRTTIRQMEQDLDRVGR